ncbi:MAG: Bifunctional protein GlmU [Chroococcidiopsis sp. SAG 2025]|uniref:nucleotidyltransferase family protein n=1 Tax=Chroococcidiopsis sp. SAG 2025 TaxID=171389 RepID=UPI00293736EC|nr:nucleotidyltransferase family protein [Chroococcidiopsis sp. SAG 2025]MDV2993573.1 Bifunctional protein GlmU [Chroococcidiopsis sp. SAG 2025]
MGQVAIAILAAGRGSRFGGDSPKPLAMFRGRSLVSYALKAAGDSGLAPILLVVGYNFQQVATAALPGVNIVHNLQWQSGIASSLKQAVWMLEPNSSIDALCIGLADQPFVTAACYRRLVATYHEGASFVVATYKGTRCNPVLLARSLWIDAMKLDGDEGARQLMRVYPVVEVSCDRIGNPHDIDTKDDLQQLESEVIPKNWTED